MNNLPTLSMYSCANTSTPAFPTSTVTLFLNNMYGYFVDVPLILFTQVLPSGGATSLNRFCWADCGYQMIKLNSDAPEPRPGHYAIQENHVPLVALRYVNASLPHTCPFVNAMTKCVNVPDSTSTKSHTRKQSPLGNATYT